MPCQRKLPSPFRYFNSSPEVIRLVVLMYVRLPRVRLPEFAPALVASLIDGRHPVFARKIAGEARMRIQLSIAIALLTVASPAMSQTSDFNLTYHVERTPAAKLSMATCSDAAARVARQSGLRVALQNFPGQLAMVSGGRTGAGALVVQCIAVGNMTVSVVQGIDYRSQKASLGQIADRVFAAVKASIR